MYKNSRISVEPTWLMTLKIQLYKICPEVAQHPTSYGWTPTDTVICTMSHVLKYNRHLFPNFETPLYICIYIYIYIYVSYQTTLIGLIVMS
jgi:hypothetical protein